MSRAFVKESDREVEVVPVRPVREHPNYVTPAGTQQLRARLQQAERDASSREIADAQERLASAVVVDPAAQNRKSVAFGAHVTVELPDKTRQSYQIVGEDEADPMHGTISWLSPLAQALLDRRAGQRAVWVRPAGNVSVRIVSVEYK